MSEPRYFTVAEANRTLPLVRRIVEDIVEGYAELRMYREVLASRAGENGDPKPASEAEAAVLESRIRQRLDQLAGYLAELEQIGCELKDFSLGLVDFRAKYQGRTVLLCWKRGEPAVEHWHEIHAGYAGRQPITEEFERAVGLTSNGH